MRLLIIIALLKVDLINSEPPNKSSYHLINVYKTIKELREMA